MLTDAELLLAAQTNLAHYPEVFTLLSEILSKNKY